MTAIHRAARRGYSEIVKLLRDYDADMNASNKVLLAA